MTFFRYVSAQDALHEWIRTGGTIVVCKRCLSCEVVPPGAPWPPCCAECSAPYSHRADLVPVGPPAKRSG